MDNKKHTRRMWGVSTGESATGVADMLEVFELCVDSREVIFGMDKDERWIELFYAFTIVNGEPKYILWREDEGFIYP